MIIHYTASKITDIENNLMVIPGVGNVLHFTGHISNYNVMVDHTFFQLPKLFLQPHRFNVKTLFLVFTSFLVVKGATSCQFKEKTFLFYARPCT